MGSFRAKMCSQAMFIMMIWNSMKTKKWFKFYIRLENQNNYCQKCVYINHEGYLVLEDVEKTKKLLST